MRITTTRVLLAAALVLAILQGMSLVSNHYKKQPPQTSQPQQEQRTGLVKVRHNYLRTVIYEGEDSNVYELEVANGWILDGENGKWGVIVYTPDAKGFEPGQVRILRFEPKQKRLRLDCSKYGWTAVIDE